MRSKDVIYTLLISWIRHGKWLHVRRALVQSECNGDSTIARYLTDSLGMFSNRRHSRQATKLP